MGSVCSGTNRTLAAQRLEDLEAKNGVERQSVTSADDSQHVFIPVFDKKSTAKVAPARTSSAADTVTLMPPPPLPTPSPVTPFANGPSAVLLPSPFLHVFDECQTEALHL